jgi:hypothetical protein
LLSVDTAGTPTGSTWRRDRGRERERRGEEIGEGRGEEERERRSVGTRIFKVYAS